MNSGHVQLAASCTGECQKSGPIGFAVILVLCVLCYFLFKSMSKHLRKVREEFPGQPGATAAVPPSDTPPSDTPPTDPTAADSTTADADPDATDPAAALSDAPPAQTASSDAGPPTAT